MIGSPTIDRTHPTIVPRRTVDPVSPADHPGRWVGGVAGAVSSLLAAGVIAVLSGDANPARNAAVLIPLLGVPIGFVLGRHLFPLARPGGWSAALGAGLLLGWIAPPLGAIEIFLGPGLLTRAAADTGLGTSGWLGLVFFLPFGLVFSYLAVVITIPVGLAWAVLVKLIPIDAPARLRAPRTIERLGARHLILALVLWGIAVQVGLAPAFLSQGLPR